MNTTGNFETQDEVKIPTLPRNAKKCLLLQTPPDSQNVLESYSGAPWVLMQMFEIKCNHHITAFSHIIYLDVWQN